MRFPTVGEASLTDIWYNSATFARFRGTAWMDEPCRSCERREIDWGGCRCQAFALAGDAARTDPACVLSSDHALLAAALGEAEEVAPDFVYRRHSATLPRLPEPVSEFSAAVSRSALSKSPTLQVCLSLGPSQLFDDCLNLWRIAKQADPAANPATGLQAERGFRLLVMRVGH